LDFHFNIRFDLKVPKAPGLTANGARAPGLIGAIDLPLNRLFTAGGFSGVFSEGLQSAHNARSD
jgi:hypothetical protein